MVAQQQKTPGMCVNFLKPVLQQLPQTFSQQLHIKEATAEQTLFHVKVHKRKLYHRFLLTGMKPWSLEHLVRTADKTP